MKRAQILMSIIIVSGAIALYADDPIPKRLDFNRYTAMVDRSPFAVATAPTQEAGPPAWSKDLFIANAGHTPEGDSVTIMSLSDKNLKEYVTTEKSNDHGYGIAAIEWADNPGGTKVTISKDSQFATIGFNEALMSQGGQPGQPPGAPNIPGAGMKPQPVQPGMPNVPNAGSRQQPNAAQPAAPAPHVRGPIQRPRQIPPSTPAQPPIQNTAPLDAPDS